MSTSKCAPVHLVGSFPAQDAATAFTQCCTALKGQLAAVPDGEPGWRWNFTIGLVQKKAQENPAIGKIWREYDANIDPVPVKDMPEEEINELREAIKQNDWSLGYAADAAASYATFLKLREEGVIEPGVRFQVCLPGMSSFAIFVKPAFQYLVEDLAYKVLLKETEEIVAAIPAADLALQFDIASDFIKTVSQRFPEYVATLREDFHPPAEDAKERYSSQYAGLISAAPAEVTTGIHICMGNINNKPVLAPEGMDIMVELLDAIRQKATRPLNWVHFGALPEWTTAAPYEALKKLADQDLAVYVGVVYPDDPEGARQRLEAAKSVLATVGVAPPCGLARTSDAGVKSVLSIMNELGSTAA